jgi:hypothetical protein
MRVALRPLAPIGDGGGSALRSEDCEMRLALRPLAPIGAGGGGALRSEDCEMKLALRPLAPIGDGGGSALRSEDCASRLNLVELILLLGAQGVAPWAVLSRAFRVKRFAALNTPCPWSPF